MITPTHTPVANYSVIAWAATCPMKWRPAHSLDVGRHSTYTVVLLQTKHKRTIFGKFPHGRWLF